MIYFVENFYFPDFGGFGWTDGAKYALPHYREHITAVESATTWEEIEELYRATYPKRKKVKLVEAAVDAPFKDCILALGRLILPLNFFRRPDKHNPPREGARRYEPIEPWRVYVGNMDGDTSWWKGPVREDEQSNPENFHEPLDEVFDALTTDLEGQIWVDWHRFPPKQQTLMQHWGTELQARKRP